ncbi:hypothetical protein FAI41_03405 [Acetobacteraceae bacterium]|nr:hypothetical protein FAI41_03405 [Acetobacteraceae bacterium]
MICLVGHARNENQNLNEWLSYHRKIGVDKVYLICNDDDPTAMFKTVLPWIEDGFVIFRHNPQIGLQIEAYMRWIFEHKDDCGWISFLDIDEYITLAKHRTLPEYLATFPKDVDCIYLNWFNFGHNNHESLAHGRILQSYNRRHKKMSSTVKIIIRSTALDPRFMQQHLCPFNHGIGGGSTVDNPFNAHKLTRVFADGSPFEILADNQISMAFSEKMRSIASISHYYMRHTGYYQERVQRGLAHLARTGNPCYLLHWKEKFDSGEYLIEMKAANETEDNLLKDWSILHYGKNDGNIIL